MRQVGQGTAIQVLAHALVDAGIGALQIEQAADDVDVEVLAGKPGCSNDRVGEREHELGQRGVAELGIPQLVELVGREHRGVAHQPVGEALKRALAASIGIVGLFQRVDQPA